MQLQFQIFPNYLFMQLQFFFPELILHKYFCGRVSEKLMVEQSDDFFWSVSSQLGRFSMKKYLWSVIKKSSVSRIQRFLYFWILCCVLEK